MEARTFEKEKRGQVGIGTLIVFIAMVLVAAIAAGVLINTAGFLQSQSEQTGEESTSQVTDRLDVLGVTGNVTDVGTDREVDKINITVSKASGSEDIDLAGVTIDLVGPDGSYFLENDVDETEDADGTFSHSPLRDMDESDPIVASTEDRFRLTLNLSNGAQHANLEEGQNAELTLTAQAGGQSTLRISVPESLAGEEAVSL